MLLGIRREILPGDLTLGDDRASPRPLKAGPFWHLSEPEPTEPLFRGGNSRGSIYSYREGRAQRQIGKGCSLFKSSKI